MNLAAEYFRRAGFPSGRYDGDETFLMVGENVGVGADAVQVAQQQFARLGFHIRLRRVSLDAVSASLTLPPGSTCDDASPVTRRYGSFSEAANENGLSRILVGFHFRNAVDDGIEHGRRIGSRAVNRFLRPPTR